MEATLEASTVKVHKRDPTDTHLYGEEIPAENNKRTQVTYSLSLVSVGISMPLPWTINVNLKIVQGVNGQIQYSITDQDCCDSIAKNSSVKLLTALTIQAPPGMIYIDQLLVYYHYYYWCGLSIPKGL